MLYPMIWSGLVLACCSAKPQFTFEDGPPSPSRPSLPFQEEEGRIPPPPPPPPAMAVSESQLGGGSLSQKESGVANNNLPPFLKWIFDSNCPDDRPPFRAGRWISVDSGECPAAFVGDNFRDHSSFCRSGGSLSNSYDGERTWLFDGGRSVYCYSLPYLLCPILGKCNN